MTYKAIVKNLKKKLINAESALNLLAEIGYSPALLNDDNGHWAVTFDGMQDVSSGRNPIDCSMYIFVEADNWKNTIYEALLYSLEKE